MLYSSLLEDAVGPAHVVMVPIAYASSHPLTLLCLMECPTLINWTSPFPFEGLLVLFFHFFQILYNRTFCKQTEETLDQMPRFVASYLGLHCLHISHKRDIRLMWVNTFHTMLLCHLLIYFKIDFL